MIRGFALLAVVCCYFLYVSSGIGNVINAYYFPDNASSEPMLEKILYLLVGLYFLGVLVLGNFKLKNNFNGKKNN